MRFQPPRSLQRGDRRTAFTALCLRGWPQGTNPWVMAFRARRRLFCLLTAVLFALSSVAQVYAATEAVMKMPAAAMESSTESSAPDHGMDCGGGGDKAARAACVAMCATAVAILGEPIAIPFVVTAQYVESDPELPPRGRGPSPEIHPPKR